VREAIASALRANLRHQERDEEPPIVRIGALAAVPRLGSLLVRLKAGNDARAFAPCVLLIAGKLPRQVGFGIRRRIADCALREWVLDGCHACMGAGVTMLGARKVACHACQGTGKHRYSDWERAGALRVREAGKWARLLVQAHRAIAGADGIAGMVLRRELERP
jgi:hypothetical protein